MTKKVTIAAPCKLNIHLDVQKIRSDGFHDLVSLFQLISLADELTVFSDGAPLSCNVVCQNLSLPADNTVTKAVASFRRETGIQTGICVELKKRVPSGAGLGGGSSDAAAVLHALNALFDAGLDTDSLYRCAARVGSDVPFFITGGTALVSGRGEMVKPVVGRDDLHFVVIWPEVFCSTAQAYRMVDTAAANGNRGGQPLLDTELVAEYAKSPREWLFFNSFFAPVSQSFSAIADAVNDLKRSGAEFSALTGSGSAVFGVFSCAEQADTAFMFLKQKWQYCYNETILSAYPDPVVNRSDC